jgi:hypothetical protein
MYVVSGFVVICGFIGYNSVGVPDGVIMYTSDDSIGHTSVGTPDGIIVYTSDDSIGHTSVDTSDEVIKSIFVVSNIEFMCMVVVSAPANPVGI